MTIGDAFGLYRLDCIVFRNQSVKTEENYNSTCKRLVEFCGEKSIEELTLTEIRNWKIWLDKGTNGKPRDPSTVRGYVICLRNVMHHLQLHGYKVVNYELIAVPKRAQKIPEFLTPDQVRELIECVSNPTRGYANINRLRNRAVISLLYASGIRASELCSLNRSDIRPDNTFTVVGKGKKPRLCFLDQRTREFLEEYLAYRTDTNPALFIANQNGLRMSNHTLERIFECARGKVSFETPVHAHTMRHSFATDLLRNKASIRYVQDMLGHSSLATTQIYTHVVNADLAEVYAEHHSY